MESKTMAILDQVRKLYQRYGIKSVTMDDVAQSLNISKKTLYAHFKDKEDLIRQVMRHEDENRCDFFSEIEKKNQNAIDELFEVHKMINGIFKEYNPAMEYDIRKYYPGLFFQIKETRRKRMVDAVQKNLNKGKKEGLYRNEMNSGILVKFHVFSIENLIDNDFFSQDELTSFKVFHEIFIYHLQGILSHEGRIYFENNYGKFKLASD